MKITPAQRKMLEKALEDRFGAVCVYSNRQDRMALRLVDLGLLMPSYSGRADYYTTKAAHDLIKGKKDV